jgi:Zn-dependent peptidase ImmA (M78 family)
MRAEQDANDLLQKVWTEGSPTHIRLPVDPFSIARKLGINVYIDDSLPPEVSGLLRKRPGFDPEIVLNGRDSRNRQRFTCAHELGHYYSRVQSGGFDEAWEYVDRRDYLSSQGSDPGERYANRFAAALLMPEAAIKQLGTPTQAASLAYEFGVSAEAMGFRLKNLQLI